MQACRWRRVGLRLIRYSPGDTNDNMDVCLCASMQVAPSMIAIDSLFAGRHEDNMDAICASVTVGD